MSIAEKFEVIADEVYEKGKKDEYDKFWDEYQNYGKRTNYGYAFRGYGFNNQNFYPKYDIRPVSYATQLFYAWSNITDISLRNINLKERLEECGVVLDLSKATDVTSAFAYFFSSELPTIDLTSVNTSCSMVFADNGGELKKIEKLVLAETTPFANNWFRGCSGLISLTVEGTIGQNNFNVSPCTKLSGASIVSIIEALSDTTSGLTVTLSQTAVDNMAFPIVGNKGTYNSWTDLEQSRTNWTISLL